MYLPQITTLRHHYLFIRIGISVGNCVLLQFQFNISPGGCCGLSEFFFSFNEVMIATLVRAVSSRRLRRGFHIICMRMKQSLPKALLSYFFCFLNNLDRTIAELEVPGGDIKMHVRHAGWDLRLYWR